MHFSWVLFYGTGCPGVKNSKNICMMKARQVFKQQQQQQFIRLY